MYPFSLYSCINLDLICIDDLYIVCFGRYEKIYIDSQNGQLMYINIYIYIISYLTCHRTVIHDQKQAFDFSTLYFTMSFVSIKIIFLKLVVHLSFNIFLLCMHAVAKLWFVNGQNRDHIKNKM